MHPLEIRDSTIIIKKNPLSVYHLADL